MRLADHGRACDLLKDVKTPALQAAANILRVHAYGAIEEYAVAKSAFELLPHAMEPIQIEIEAELRARFIDRKPSEHDEALVAQDL